MGLERRHVREEEGGLAEVVDESEERECGYRARKRKGGVEVGSPKLVVGFCTRVLTHIYPLSHT